MTWLFPTSLAIHITAGLLCVMIGWLPVLSRKGGRLHSLAGRAYAWMMGVMLAAAWIMTVIHFSSYFLALSAMATLTVFSGLRVLRRKRPDLRAEDRARPLDWAVTSGIVGVGLWTLFQVATGQAGDKAAVSSALAYGGVVYGGYDLWRFARPTDWPFSPQLWMYEHLAKMLGAYGAVLSAFSGNFITFIPEPWSQLWPSLLFQPLVVIWIATLALRRRGSVTQAA
jgi:uncharacterized membrane protein